MKKPLYKRLFTYFCAALIVSGFVGFFGAALISLRAINYSGEVPFGDVQDIAMDTAGDIFVAVGMYGKIQVYDSTGKFLRNWSSFSGGKLDMGRDEGDHIKVISEKARKQITYDHYGKILADSDIADEYDKPDSLRKIFWYYDDTIRLSGTPFFPVVTKSNKGTTVLIRQSLFLQLINGEVAWLGVFFGVSLLVLINRKKIALKRERKDMLQ